MPCSPHLCIVGPTQPGERHEVWQLPEVQPRRQDARTDVEAARSRRPAHERRHRPDHRADPRVGDADHLEGGVDPRIQGDVGRAQSGGEAVCL